MNESVLTPVDELFGKPYKRRFKIIMLPISGATVRIRSLTERELSAHQNAAYIVKDASVSTSKARMEDATRRFLALCLCDADGNRLITAADCGKFAEWDSADSSFLYNECSAHTRTKPEDIEASQKTPTK